MPPDGVHFEPNTRAGLEWLGAKANLDRFDLAKLMGDGGLEWLSKPVSGSRSFEHRVFEPSQRGRVMTLTRGYTQTSEDVWFVVQAGTGMITLHTEWSQEECEDKPETWPEHGLEVLDAGEYIVVGLQCALHRHPAAVGASVWLLDVGQRSADGKPFFANARIAGGTEAPRRITLDVEGRPECEFSFDPGE